MSDSSIAPFAEPHWHHTIPPPYYKSSHLKLQAETRKYVDEFIAPFAAEWEKNGAVPAEVYRRHAEKGFVAAGVFPPEPQYLGSQKLPSGIPVEEWDGFHDHIVVDELTRCGFMGVVWALNCGNVIGCPPLVHHGTPEQKHRLLPSIYKGTTRFCLAVTEPGGKSQVYLPSFPGSDFVYEADHPRMVLAGSDVANVTTVAQRQGNKYIVNGEKKWITNGVYADFCTAAVRTGGPGQDGISALIIPLKVTGVTLRRMENSGIHASGSTYIEFDDVEVPVENLLGTENHGFALLMNNFNQERLWLSTICLRLARVCAADAYNYAMVRETFGKKLVENQVIRAKFVDFGKHIQATYAWLEQILWARERQRIAKEPEELGASAAMVKILSARTLENTVREAQQIFGGAGYSKTGRGNRVEQISRDFRVLVVGGGSEEILTDLGFRQEVRFLKQKAAKNSKL